MDGDPWGGHHGHGGHGKKDLEFAIETALVLEALLVVDAKAALFGDGRHPAKGFSDLAETASAQGRLTAPHRGHEQGGEGDYQERRSRSCCTFAGLDMYRR